MDKIVKKRDEWVSSSREELLSRAKDYQTEIVKYLHKQYLTKLDQKDGNIVFSAKNLATVSELSSKLNKIAALKGDELLDWFSGQIEENAKLNEKYFKEISGSKGIQNYIKKSTESIKKILGFEKNGTLYDLSRIYDPIRKIKSQVIKGISTGQSWGKFSNDISNFVNKGVVESYLRTNAYDTFQQVDRTMQKNLAFDLDLKYVVYSPGLMKTSRQFCRDRVGKVFSLEEVDKWKNLDWDGKNENYNPLTDVGGHNCTHILTFVTDDFAFDRRPELSNK